MESVKGKGIKHYPSFTLPHLLSYFTHPPHFLQLLLLLLPVCALQGVIAVSVLHTREVVHGKHTEWQLYDVGAVGLCVGPCTVNGG